MSLFTFKTINSLRCSRISKMYLPNSKLECRKQKSQKTSKITHIQTIVLSQRLCIVPRHWYQSFINTIFKTDGWRTFGFVKSYYNHSEKKKVHLLKSERQGVDHRGLRKQNTGECWYHIDELKETLKKREDKNKYCVANNIMITPHSWCLKSIEFGHLEVLWKVTVTVISWRKKLFNSGFARF